MMSLRSPLTTQHTHSTRESTTLKLTSVLRAIGLMSVLAFAGGTAVTAVAADPGGGPATASAAQGSTPGPSAIPGGAMQVAVGSAPSGITPTSTSGTPGIGDVPTANIAGSSGTMKDFLVSVLTDVDTYWAGVWKDDGRPAPFVTYAFPAAGEVVLSLCAPGFSDDMSAFYCLYDDKITVSQSLAQKIWDGTLYANTDGTKTHDTGDFSVAYVVAHEYAHELQNEIGIFTTAGSIYPVYKIELHADCWAGVWAKSAEDEGILDKGDIKEAGQTTLDLGDYAFDNPQHHGTPEQRNEAFLAGYDGGSEGSCDGWLNDTY